MLTALQVSREASREIISLISDHSAKIASGTIVEFQPNAVSFRENIDRPLHEATARLLVNGVIALKQVQEVTRIFAIEIRGIFQKQTKFESAMRALVTAGHTALEKYLRTARQTWMESFIQCRADFEHEGWTLPRIEYVQIGPTTFGVGEPGVCGLPISQFSAISVRRLLGFVENVVVYAFKVSLPAPITIVEIPPSQRDPNFPRRFKVNLRSQYKLIEWLPRYSDNDFP